MRFHVNTIRVSKDEDLQDYLNKIVNKNRLITIIQIDSDHYRIIYEYLYMKNNLIKE
jgi:regulatory protein YycI of two-component signal transduction system YycFG